MLCKLVLGKGKGMKAEPEVSQNEITHHCIITIHDESKVNEEFHIKVSNKWNQHWNTFLVHSIQLN